ncbi:MAG TPA: hypothetical protein VK024_09820 [Actinomycetaceae bacterium]|nr:hypothetical protein [Actinomycetaceae bacterium]
MAMFLSYVVFVIGAVTASAATSRLRARRREARRRATAPSSPQRMNSPVATAAAGESTVPGGAS